MDAYFGDETDPNNLLVKTYVPPLSPSLPPLGVPWLTSAVLTQFEPVCGELIWILFSLA